MAGVGDPGDGVGEPAGVLAGRGGVVFADAMVVEEGVGVEVVLGGAVVELEVLDKIGIGAEVVLKGGEGNEVRGAGAGVGAGDGEEPCDVEPARAGEIARGRGGVSGHKAAEGGADHVHLGGERGVGGGEFIIDGADDLVAGFLERAAKADDDGDDAIVVDMALELALEIGGGDVGVEIAADDDQGSGQGLGVGAHVAQGAAGIGVAEREGGVYRFGSAGGEEKQGRDDE